MTISRFARFTGPWLIIILVGSVLSVLISQRQNRASAAAEHFRAFIVQLDLGRYSEARVEIERAVRLSPGNAYYASNFGLLEERVASSFDSESPAAYEHPVGEQSRQHVEAAILWYEKALALNPNDGSFQHNLGWLLRMLNQHEPALERFRSALALEPNSAIYRISLGMALERAGIVRDALSEYSAAIRLSPGVVDSRFFSDLKRRLPSEAEEAVLVAIKELEAGAVRDPVLKARLGKLYLYRGNVEALETLRQVTVELPNLPRPWLHLGILQERQQEYEEAKRSFDRAVFLGGDYLAFLQLGRLYDRADRTADAIRNYQSAISSWQWKSPESTRNIQRVYLTTNIVPDNVVPTGFLSYVQPDFDLAGTCSRLASLHLISGNPEQAAYYDELGKKTNFQFRIAR